ncbi:hypothetical protein PUNSTDRAFT_139406 [Punctularia strigosozonata HHB-11173 SS5]|uniref:Uncharacterized protein n=1 Tax=Punctularia strigosozonata (strain HHB-11173) TaxID=741275 RepID=R7RZW4_PUNST|nr:uncharacterized protein PUNSTDRAFT_139406 [Punctularia strigosozonata HHB-11173 SS5]EIN03523.1 hypothetical protein PUNSTDRAFT_139406 [Punctularia strigosozonata HHB-11173 SS5]
MDEETVSAALMSLHPDTALALLEDLERHSREYNKPVPRTHSLAARSGSQRQSKARSSKKQAVGASTRTKMPSPIRGSQGTAGFVAVDSRETAPGGRAAFAWWLYHSNRKSMTICKRCVKKMYMCDGKTNDADVCEYCRRDRCPRACVKQPELSQYQQLSREANSHVRLLDELANIVDDPSDAFSKALDSLRSEINQDHRQYKRAFGGR